MFTAPVLCFENGNTNGTKREFIRSINLADGIEDTRNYFAPFSTLEEQLPRSIKPRSQLRDSISDAGHLKATDDRDDGDGSILKLRISDI